MKKTIFLCFLFFAAGPVFSQGIGLTPPVYLPPTSACTPADHGAPNFVTFASTSQASPGFLQVWAFSYEPIHDVSARVAFSDGTQASSAMVPAKVFSFLDVGPVYLSGGRVGASCFIQTTSSIADELDAMGLSSLGPCSGICSGRIPVNDLLEIAKLPQVIAFENSMYMTFPVGPPSPCGNWVYYTCVHFDPAAQSISAVTVTGASASGAVGTSDGSFIMLEYDAANMIVDPVMRSAASKLMGFFYLPFASNAGGVRCPPSTPTPTATPFPTPVPSDTLWVSENLFRPSKGAGELEIRAGIHRAGSFPLEIYNSAGEKVKTLGPIVLEEAGEETLAWDGTNQNGEDVASGIYLIRVVTGLGVMKARVLLLR